jgi:5-hydroxyisourate hydrolase
MTSLLSTKPSEKKTPITCHVLNTVTGTPASDIPVTLQLVQPYGPSNPLTATTNLDGRVTTWTSSTGGPSLEELFANAYEHDGTNSSREDVAATTGEGLEEAVGSTEMVWALKFDVGSYFKGEGFWTVVEIRFKTKLEQDGREHWHVPLLLSPYAYSTYRGS